MTRQTCGSIRHFGSTTGPCTRRKDHQYLIRMLEALRTLANGFAKAGGMFLDSRAVVPFRPGLSCFV